MKLVEQIIKTPEYRYHTFTAALKNFACVSGTSLYFDSTSNIAIIYHLSDSKSLNKSHYADEIKISRIPNILEVIEDQIDKDTYNTLQEIYDKFNKIAAQYGYEDYCMPDLLATYEISSYPEMWENQEFSETFKADVAAIVKQLQPIQDLVAML